MRHKKYPTGRIAAQISKRELPATDIERNLESLVKPLVIGNKVAGDYTEIREDGTQRLVGGATSWQDMVGDLFGKKLLSTSGKVDYDFDNNTVIFAKGGSISVANDRIGSNLQINHQFRVGTGIVFKPHIHWFQAMTNESSVSNELWTVPYAGAEEDLAHIPIEGTVVVGSTEGGSQYEEDTDYTINYTTGTITTVNIASGATAHIAYDYILGTVTTTPFLLTMRYRLQRNGMAQTTAWTMIDCEVGAGGADIFDFSDKVSGTYNQLSRFPDIVVECSVSDTLQFQVARTDDEDGDMAVYFMDLHGEVDSFGSDEEVAKRP